MAPEVDPDEAREGLDVPPVEPRPYCRFLAADMVDRHNRLAFSEQARREMPYATVGISEHEDGQGSTMIRLAAPAPRVTVGPETFDVLAKLSAATGEPIHEVIAYMVDDLTVELTLPITELTRQLMTLELKKVVRRLPGNWYERF